MELGGLPINVELCEIFKVFSIRFVLFQGFSWYCMHSITDLKNKKHTYRTLITFLSEGSFWYLKRVCLNNNIMWIALVGCVMWCRPYITIRLNQLHNCAQLDTL